MRWLPLVITSLLLNGCFDPQPGSHQELPEPAIDIVTDGLLNEGRVVKVADADSVTIRAANGGHYKVRLQGIDAPEKQQQYGALCTEKARQLLHNENVQVEAYKRDRYQRVVAKLRLDGEDVALSLIRQGCGWHYKQYAREQSPADQQAYAAAERSAKQERIGLWRAARPIPPWEYRRRY